MSSIAGFFLPNNNFTNANSFCTNTIQKMSFALAHRGPDHSGYYHFNHGCFNHNLLKCSVAYPTVSSEAQPTTKKYYNKSYTLLMDGFISNLDDLILILNQANVITKDLSVEEILLCAFIRFGPMFAQKLSGGFAIAIYDEMANELFLFRDPLGLRPLFYYAMDKTLVFASEIKGLLAYPDITPTLDSEGLCELLSIGPARSVGNAVFKNIREVRPGCYLTFSSSLCEETRFHQFQLKPHTDSYEDTLSHVKDLLDRSFQSLTFCNSPFATLLSGGLDSSIVSAKLKETLAEEDSLHTYSFDFYGSKQFFQSNHFQPTLDAPYVSQMKDSLASVHNVLQCGNKEQFHYLKKSVDAHDLPSMADVDSSLLYFCEQISPNHKIIFTGECADELFCGYPWYHKEEMYSSNTFPWSTDFVPRMQLLKDNLHQHLNIKDYAMEKYLACSFELFSDKKELSADQLHQKTMYLTIRYFMQTLINRTDRAASANSMDARVPFADLKLAEYLMNVPYAFKTKDGEIKHLLREYSKPYLPDSVRLRKKSPYPKTYDPGYEQLLCNAMRDVLSKTSSPILEIVDKEKVLQYCSKQQDIGLPWYGQLMARPQLIAYYLQINYWMEKYNILLKL